MSYYNNGIFPDNFSINFDQDPVDDKSLSSMPPPMQSVDSALGLIDSSHGSSHFARFNQSYIPQGLFPHRNFPGDPDHVAKRDFQDDSARRTSYLDPDKIADGLAEISDAIPSLNYAQVLRLRSQLESVLQKVDRRLRQPRYPIEQLPTPMASSSHHHSPDFGAFCCPLCETDDRLFKELSSLREHLQDGHGIQEWGYQCPEPGCTVTEPHQEAMSEHRLYVHKQTSTLYQRSENIIQIPSPAVCKLCSQTTATWNEFYQHAKDHWMQPARNKISQEGLRADEDKLPIGERGLSEVDAGNAILSHGVDKEPAPSLAPREREPQEPIMQLSLSHGSDSSAAHSVTTNITTPESEEDSIDVGIPETKNMDHILDAARYFSELDQLELQTAQILGMLNGPSIKLDSLDDCIECLGNWQAALEYLQSQGFCGNMISILIEDQDQDGVASAFHVSLSQVGALLQTILSTLEDDALKQSAKAWMQTILNLDSKTISDGDSVGILRFLCKLLSIGLLAFSGSHVCRFDINLWDQEMEEIPVGFNEYAFKPRKLACLDDFIGGPAWILGKATSPPEGMKVSLTVQDLQELWGPVSLVGGTAEEAPIIQTERGFIVPLGRQSFSKSSACEEIECHWVAEISRHIFDESSRMKIVISSRSRLLIGTSTNVKPGLVVNDKCKSSISSIGQQIACRLQYPGTSKSRYVSDGYDVQLGGGQYVTAGLVKKYKRIPKRTLKAMLIADCTKPDTKLVPLLTLRVGLEVSACTGNAQRVTLWDALRFSQTSTQDTDHRAYCAHKIGDKNCISSCWTRWRSVDDIDSIDQITAQSKFLSGLEARRVIINSILALEHSGIDGEGNLQVSWPFSYSPANCPVLPSTPKESHNWFRVVKDTRDTSCFSVFSQRCLELPEKGKMRSCSAPCKEGHSKPLKTTLSTSIMTPAEEGSVPGLLVGVQFLVGEAHLTVTKAVQDQLAIIATVSMNPFNPLRHRFREILQDTGPFVYKEHIWPDTTAGLSVPVFVY